MQPVNLAKRLVCLQAILFLGFLDRILNIPHSTITGVAVSSGVPLPLFYHVSNFNVMNGNFLRQLSCFWIFIFANLPMIDRLLGFIRL